MDKKMTQSLLSRYPSRMSQDNSSQDEFEEISQGKTCIICPRSLWEDDIHKECPLHRKCISKSTISWVPEICINCIAMDNQQIEGVSLQTKMNNLLTAWRRVNNIDPKTNLNSPCPRKTYVLEFPIQDFEGFSPATSFLQRKAREQDLLTPSPKRQKKDHKNIDTEKITNILVSFQKSIEERLRKQDERLDMINNVNQQGDDTTDSDSEDPSDQDSISGGEDVEMPMSLLQSQEFDFTPLDIDKDIQSKIVLKQAWPLIRGSFATHFKDAVIPKQGRNKKVNELQISKKSLNLILRGLDNPKEKIIGTATTMQKYLPVKTPLNTDTIKVYSSEVKELEDFLKGIPIPNSIQENIPFSATQGDKCFKSIVLSLEANLRTILKEATISKDMTEVLSKFLEKFRKEDNKDILDAFTGVMEAMSENVIYRLCNLIATIRLDCRKSMLKKCNSGQKFRLMDAPLIAKKLFPEDKLEEFFDRFGNSQLKFQQPGTSDKKKAWKKPTKKFRKRQFFPREGSFESHKWNKDQSSSRRGKPHKRGNNKNSSKGSKKNEA